MYKKFKLANMIGIITLSLTNIAFADVIITNKSDSDAVGHLAYYGCSSSAGSQGIISPHSYLTVYQYMLDLFCGSKCEIDLYMSATCTGKKTATVTMGNQSGVISVVNYDEANYTISGGGSELTIEQTHKGISHWLKGLL